MLLVIDDCIQMFEIKLFNKCFMQRRKETNNNYEEHMQAEKEIYTMDKYVFKK